MILPFYEEIPLDDVRRVAVVTVTQGATKPYVVRYRGGKTSTSGSAVLLGWLRASSRRGFLLPVG